MYIDDKETFTGCQAINDTDAMHLWRSKFIDKASKCEGEIRRIASKPADKKMPFKALAEKILAERIMLEAGKKSEPLVKLLEELLPLIDLRAELAHSQIVSESRGATGYLFLRNAQSSHKHFEKIVSLTLDHRKVAYDRMSSIAGQIAKLT